MATKMMWSCMVQLGMAMWYKHLSDTLVFDRKLWKEWSEYLAECGCNNIVLDIGEGLIYDCHPELAAKGAYTKAEMKEELARLAELGIEVVPKLNFSTCHNMWMGKYTRMISSEPYYRFVEEMIDETCEIFRPRYFHLGMDEESMENDIRFFDYIVLRQKDLWWHDLYHMTERVERHGARAVIWADYARDKPQEFVEKLPKSVIPSVWYYFTQFENFHDAERKAAAYEKRVMPLWVCNDHGFDQFPAGSNLYHRENLELLTRYCQSRLDGDKFLGVMQTPWLSTTEKNRAQLFEAADTIRESRAAFEAMMR